MADKNSNPAEALLELGGACLKREEYPGAEAAAEAALHMLPSSHAGWVLLGTALAKQSKHERAVSCFERATSLDPKDIASHTSLGELLLDLGAYSRAAKALEAAMALDPDAKHPAGRRARALVGRTLSTLKA